MQLAHDMSTIHEGFTKFVELGRSLDNQVKMVVDGTEVANELLKASKAWETMLQELLDASWSSSKAAIRGLETRIAKKKKILTKRWEHIAELETQQNEAESLLQAANEKVKVAKEQFATAATRAIKEHEKMESFVREVAEAAMNAYEVRFADCKNKVAQAYL